MAGAVAGDLLRVGLVAGFADHLDLATGFSNFDSTSGDSANVRRRPGRDNNGFDELDVLFDDVVPPPFKGTIVDFGDFEDFEDFDDFIP